MHHLSIILFSFTTCLLADSIELTDGTIGNGSICSVSTDTIYFRKHGNEQIAGIPLSVLCYTESNGILKEYNNCSQNKQVTRLNSNLYSSNSTQNELSKSNQMSRTMHVRRSIIASSLTATGGTIIISAAIPTLSDHENNNKALGAALFIPIGAIISLPGIIIFIIELANSQYTE